MASTEERMQILKMIQDGKITADEGAKLLSALSTGAKSERSERRPPVPPPPPGAPSAPGEPRWFRVRVTDTRSGRAKVSVNIPMSLVNVGLKMGARFTPNVESVNFEEIMTAVKSGASGKVLDVTDEESGEHVEIYVE
jgi:hypothetical protein